MTKDDNNMLALFGCFGVIAMMPVVSLIDGWALATMWRWFVVPIFHLPALGLAYAIGIGLVASLLTHQDKGKPDPSDTWYRPVTSALMRPLVTLGIAWIVRLFV